MKTILLVLAAVLLCSCSSPVSITDAEAVARALSALTFEDMAGANAAEDDIRFDLVLPASGGNGTAIGWSSSAPSVIAVDGTLCSDTPEVEVTLTATVTKNSAEDSKEFLLTVIRRAPVDWGNLQFPTSTTTSVGTLTEFIYGRVYVAGSTENPGQGSGITAQLGYGADGSDPAAGAWTWVDADYNVDNANNDEYKAKLDVATEGSYGYAYRFSADDGNTWLYCDTNGSGDGYSSANQGDLSVVP
jgi:hypothetical protein